MSRDEFAAAQGRLLPSECPNCGRLHEGHNFNEEPGPIQAENARRFDLDDVLDKLYAARALLAATPPEPILALMNVDSVIQAVDPDA